MWQANSIERTVPRCGGPRARHSMRSIKQNYISTQCFFCEALRGLNQRDATSGEGLQLNILKPSVKNEENLPNPKRRVPRTTSGHGSTLSWGLLHQERSRTSLVLPSSYLRQFSLRNLWLPALKDLPSPRCPQEPRRATLWWLNTKWKTKVLKFQGKWVFKIGGFSS